MFWFALTYIVDLEFDRITDVVWNRNAFNNLVADNDTKELVQALVEERLATERNTDIISGKGNGLIMLLHGGPGTGKTFTAESVAEMAEKPLYNVTCGDIGTLPEDVEQYLESVLNLGKIWDCVVLLDEADVFLEERTLADLQRNALVSVFLRALEYYDGILILTSNRVGTFDEAFKSRIQLALHYDNLNKAQRLKIWKNFIDRLKAIEEPEIDFNDIECYIPELAEAEMNGRQIRNAITVARKLARKQKKKLAYTHLKHVIKVSGHFDTYLKGTKEGMTADQFAKASGIR
jgi:SpoVK/Ycf46/Vps4 family AAA+-type ATPase